LLNKDKHSVTKWISILYRYGQSHISRQLSAYNIGSGQYIFLIALYKRDGISQEELSDHLKIEKATTAKAINRLEKEGYIKREINPSDKRAYKIFLTQKAFDLKPIIFRLTKEWSDFLMSDFTEDERKIIFNLLERMANNAFASLKKNDK
jgi:DNA-binding MarR family transcriptional regulator